jgi:hypothetical protein
MQLQSNHTLFTRRAGAAAIALLLAACGAGYSGGDGLTQTEREDRAASASVAGLLAFATALIGAGTGDTAEPRPIDGITPPVSDTDEPAAL